MLLFTYQECIIIFLGGLSDSKVHPCLKLLFALGSGTSLGYFLLIVIFLFTLGNFNDFRQYII